MSLFIRQFKVVLIFYRSFIIPAMLFNMLGIFIMWTEGPQHVIGQVLLLKILSDFGIAYFVNALEKDSLYFYYNMGLGRNRLFALAFLFDLFLLVLMAIIYFSIF